MTATPHQSALQQTKDPPCQFPAVVPADGETIGSVGMTGAAVSVGMALIVGCVVTIGVTFDVGAALGALEGIVALPLIEQVHPTSASKAANTGIKKNRFIMRISFRFFSDRMPCMQGSIRLRRIKKYAILRA